MGNLDTRLDIYYKALSRIAEFYYKERQFRCDIETKIKSIHAVLNKEPTIREFLTWEQREALNSILELNGEIIQYPLIASESFMSFSESLCKLGQPSLSREQLIQPLELTDEQSYRDLITKTLDTLEQYWQEEGYTRLLAMYGQCILQSGALNQIISTLQSRHSKLYSALKGHGDPALSRLCASDMGIAGMEEAIKELGPSLKEQREALKGGRHSIKEYLRLINEATKEGTTGDLVEKIKFLYGILDSDKYKKHEKRKGYTLNRLIEKYNKKKHKYLDKKKRCEEIIDCLEGDFDPKMTVEDCIKKLERKLIKCLETEKSWRTDKVASCVSFAQMLLKPSCSSSRNSIDSGIGSVASLASSLSRDNSVLSPVSLSSRADSVYSLEESILPSTLGHENHRSIARERYSWPRCSKSQVVSMPSLPENDMQFERSVQNNDSQSKPTLALHKDMKASLETVDLEEPGQEQKGLSKQPSVRDLGFPSFTTFRLNDDTPIITSRWMPVLNSGQVSEWVPITLTGQGRSLSIPSIPLEHQAEKPCSWKEAICQAKDSKGLGEKISALAELLSCACKALEERRPACIRSDHERKSLSRLKQWLSTFRQNPDTAPEWWQRLRLKRQLQGLTKDFEKLTSRDIGEEWAIKNGLSKAIELITDIDKISKRRSAVYRNAGSGLLFSLGFLMIGGSIAALTMLSIGVIVGSVGLLMLSTLVISMFSAVFLGFGMYLVEDAVSRIKHNNHEYHVSQQVPEESTNKQNKVTPSHATVRPRACQAPRILSNYSSVFAKIPKQPEVGAGGLLPQFSK